MTENNNLYRTSDIYYAAYLKVAGVPLVRTDREGSRVFFLFEKLDTLDDLQREYFNRTSKVVAQDYADEIRAMKNLTYSG